MSRKCSSTSSKQTLKLNNNEFKLISERKNSSSSKNFKKTSKLLLIVYIIIIIIGKQSEVESDLNEKYENMEIDNDSSVDEDEDIDDDDDEEDDDDDEEDDNDESGLISHKSSSSSNENIEYITWKPDISSQTPELVDKDEDEVNKSSSSINKNVKIKTTDLVSKVIILVFFFYNFF